MRYLRSTMRLPLPVILLCVGFCALPACEGTTGSSSGRSTISYGANAREAYEHALLDFQNDKCIDAEPQFRRIRREFSYSRFAALSELRIADCKFKQKEYAEGITAYRQFVRFRPSHSLIPYARFRIAESYFAQIPSGSFLTPPSHELDPRPTNEALRNLRRFVLDFPEDDRIAESQRMIRDCLKVLANHEIYAARFYLRRDAYAAVVLRLRTVLTTYEGSGLEPEALLLLGETYIDMNDRPQAREAFRTLVERFPDSDEAGDARDQLADLGNAG